MLKLIVVGTSLGGLNALTAILSQLPAAFSMPLALVQHRHRDSEGLLVNLLQSSSCLPVVEIEDKLPIQPGTIYLAPADYHVLVEPGHFALSVDDLVLHARPSIDVLFESAADSYGPGTLGVILTGASNDGARGLKAIKAGGGIVLVQDPATAECAIMPAAALAATTVDYVVSLTDIAPKLVQLCQPQLR
jgi:two-component system, chemotaxis family, protein-glutamate methylesterase/glutaminase